MTAASGTIAIGADESIHSLEDIRRHHARGAARGVSLKTIKLGGLRGVQAELALTHLYEGDSPWRTVVDHLGDLGFDLAGVEPGFGDPDSGRMLQFDGVFLRS